MATNLSQATGRRKTAVARVFLREGTGLIRINKKQIEEYFPEPIHRSLVEQPLKVTGSVGNFDLLMTVKGGGVSGQARACAHAIARALDRQDGSVRPALRTSGLLTRDSRMVERKKYGRRGARRRFQFSKR